jgi:hypothetical protein
MASSVASASCRRPPAPCARWDRLGIKASSFKWHAFVDLPRQPAVLSREIDCDVGRVLCLQRFLREGRQPQESGPRRTVPGPDCAFVRLQRFAIYIVISMPNRNSIACGLSHFILISYVYSLTVEPETAAGPREEIDNRQGRFPLTVALSGRGGGTP